MASSIYRALRVLSMRCSGRTTDLTASSQQVTTNIASPRTNVDALVRDIDQVDHLLDQYTATAAHADAVARFAVPVSPTTHI